jgi:hypothetical protein
MFSWMMLGGVRKIARHTFLILLQELGERFVERK